MPRFSIQDILQTDGQDLPEFASVKGDPREHLEALKALIASHSIALDYDPAIAPAKGVSRGGRITLLPNQSAAEEFSTLVHELAHLCCEDSYVVVVGEIPPRVPIERF